MSNYQLNCTGADAANVLENLFIAKLSTSWDDLYQQYCAGKTILLWKEDDLIVGWDPINSLWCLVGSNHDQAGNLTDLIFSQLSAAAGGGTIGRLTINASGYHTEYTRLVTSPSYGNIYAPTNKQSNMTQPVGVDSTGKLWTAPGGGGKAEVVITESDGEYEASMTVSQITAAYAAGRQVVAKALGGILLNYAGVIASTRNTQTVLFTQLIPDISSFTVGNPAVSSVAVYITEDMAAQTNTVTVTTAVFQSVSNS